MGWECAARRCQVDVDHHAAGTEHVPMVLMHLLYSTVSK